MNVGKRTWCWNCGRRVFCRFFMVTKIIGHWLCLDCKPEPEDEDE